MGDRLAEGVPEHIRGPHLELTPELRELADALRRALGWTVEPPGGIELPQRFHDLLFGYAVGGGLRIRRLIDASAEARDGLERKIGSGALTSSAADDLSNWGDAFHGEVHALARHLAEGPGFKRFIADILYVPAGRDFHWDIGGPADLLVRTAGMPDERYPGREEELLLDGCLSIETDDPHLEVVRIAEEIQGIGLVKDIFETQPFDPRVLSRMTSIQMPGERDDAGDVDLGALSGAARLAMAQMTLAEIRPNSDLEAQRIRRGQAADLLERRKQEAAVILSAVDKRGLVLRRAGRIYLQAVVARELGVTLTTAFTCLEGMLLDGKATKEVMSRLTEAVVYRIGKGATDREELRKQLKELYELRSEYVHTGEFNRGKKLDGKRKLALDIAQRALQREIDDWGRERTPENGHIV